MGTTEDYTNIYTFWKEKEKSNYFFIRMKDVLTLKNDGQQKHNTEANSS